MPKSDKKTGHVPRKKSAETQSPVTKLFKKMAQPPSSRSSGERESLLKDSHKKGNALTSTACECQPKFIKSKQGCEDDTFSCTSCALKRCLSSDPSKLCIIVAVVIVFMLLVAMFNWLFCRPSPTYGYLGEEEIRERRSDDESTVEDGKPWDTSKSYLMNGFTELTGLAQDASGRDTDMEQFDNSMPKLSNILDPVKVTEVHNSNSLRNFYKKLLKTDVQIKNLRKSIAALKYNNNNMKFIEPNPTRDKRSLNFFRSTTRHYVDTNLHPILNRRSFQDFNLYFPPSVAVKEINLRKSDTEDSMLNDMADIPESSPITEKTKITDNDFKELKTQEDYEDKGDGSVVKEYTYVHVVTSTGRPKSNRYDYSKKVEDLLTRMLMQVPELPSSTKVPMSIDKVEMSKATELNSDSKNQAKTWKDTREKNEYQPVTVQRDTSSKLVGDKTTFQPGDKYHQYNYYKQSSSAMKSDETEKLPKQQMQSEAVTKSNYNYITLATVLSMPLNIEKFIKKEPADKSRHFSKARRLMQHSGEESEDDDDNEDNEGEDYEDLTKEPWERDKRMIGLTEPPVLNKVSMEPGKLNPNWKGPMPLYHDEIDYILNPAMKMVGKENKQREKYDHSTSSNVEYYEDSNFNAAVAQAYSDYGVFDGKQETSASMKTPRCSANLRRSEKRHGIFGRLKHFGNNRLHVTQPRKLQPIQELKSIKKSEYRENSIITPYAHFSHPMDKIAKYTNPTEFGIAHDINKENRNEKQKLHNVYTGFRRSLKSVEYQELSENDNVVGGAAVDNNNNINNTDGESKYEKGDSKKLDEINSEVNISNDFKEIAPKISKNSEQYKNSNTSLAMGDIFDVIADFSKQAGFETHKENNDPRILYNFITNLNPNATQFKKKATQNKNKDDTTRPSNDHIDSQNVGHRSRVLMTFQENQDNVTALNVANNAQTKYSTEYNNIANASNTDQTKLKGSGNRTVVKRSANGNEVFLNNLFDDHYNMDILDGTNYKSLSKKNVSTKPENRWFTKFRNMQYKMKNYNWMGRKKYKKQKETISAHKSNNTRFIRRASVTQWDTGKETFQALTANMKKVCHEAAKAIHESTYREERSNSGQATSLMRQLVGLMSDLVDIQVRQKTCVQLPDDLRSFLIWITDPNSQKPDDRDLVIESTYDIGSSAPNSLNPETGELMAPNARSECLGTIHALEDLIQQYDVLSEEDKSKVSGVREYLEHQLNYLHKQLSNFDGYGSYLYQEQIRKRRQLPKPQKDKKRRERKQKYMKFFGRKRTKSTSLTEELVTEEYTNMKHRKDKINKGTQKNVEGKRHGDKDVHFDKSNKNI